jgi:hypothetical protein
MNCPAISIVAKGQKEEDVRMCRIAQNAIVRDLQMEKCIGGQ